MKKQTQKEIFQVNNQDVVKKCSQSKHICVSSGMSGFYGKRLSSNSSSGQSRGFPLYCQLRAVSHSAALQSHTSVLSRSIMWQTPVNAKAKSSWHLGINPLNQVLRMGSRIRPIKQNMPLCHFAKGCRVPDKSVVMQEGNSRELLRFKDASQHSYQLTITT